MEHFSANQLLSEHAGLETVRRQTVPVRRRTPLIGDGVFMVAGNNVNRRAKFRPENL